MAAVPLVIAVDGPAAAGKGTLARRLAAAFDLPHLDTGLLYRAVARTLLDGSDDAAPSAERAEAVARALDAAALARADLRTPPVDRLASAIAAMQPVRAALLDWQRRFAAAGAVLDGRDIGTVVCPDAPAKLFVTASAPVRAERRLRERGDPVDAEAIRRETVLIEARDRADRERATAPLRPADDALLLDTTVLDADAAFARADELVRARLVRALPGGEAAEILDKPPRTGL